MFLLSRCTYLRFQISVRYQESSKGFFAALHSCEDYDRTEKHIYEASEDQLKVKVKPS